MVSLRSQGTFAVRCDFGNFELTEMRPEHQVQLLRHLSDAYAGFLKDLTPEEASLAGMVQRSIDSMARLKEENEHKTGTDCGISSVSTTAFMKKDDKGEADPPLPKRKTRKVSFRSEVERRTYSVNSDDESSEEEDYRPPVRSPAFILRNSDDESSEEEDYRPPVRSPAFILRRKQDSSSRLSPDSVKDASGSDNDVAKNSSNFQPIVPDKQERTPCSISARVRAVMKEVRLPNLRASRRSQQVCPE
eukprot:TRINITY_DN3828_c0_g2_i1.p1 TRINITY_DN3828_c0_g2~~TRINITY_DN3828_c0_g2_i1.p1  ORF type:complete len:247 (-),score=40.03 TRINITY_DN3828_c0_g2_i1:35-775(-)